MLTSVVHIGIVLKEMPDNRRVTAPTGQCQCRVPIAVFMCTSTPVNGRCETHGLTNVVHIRAMVDEVIDDLRVTILTSQYQCRVPNVAFKRISEPVNGRREVHVLTSVIYIGAVLDEMLDDLSVTTQTG